MSIRNLTSIVLFILFLFIFINSINAQDRKGEIPPDNSKTLFSLFPPKNSYLPSQCESYSINGYLSEGFEGTLFPPQGWGRTNVIGGNQWSRSGARQHSGLYSAFINYQAGAAGEDWLVTPQITTSSGDSLIFWIKKVYAANYPPDSLLILYSADSSLASFTQVLYRLNVNSLADTNWYRIAVACPAGNGYFAFQHKDFDGNGCYIDDVTIGTAPANDVGILAINFYDVRFKGNNTPLADVKNFGTATQSFNVNVTISPGGYSSTKTVTGLTAGSKQTVTFNTASLSPGTYTVTAVTQLATDQNKSNDTLKRTFTVLNSSPGDVYGSVAYSSKLGAIPLGLVQFNTARPDSFKYISTTANAYYAGCWVYNSWYAIDYDANTLVTINPSTGAVTTIGSMPLVSGSYWTGLTYSISDGTMYATSINIDGSSKFYSVNRYTAATTLIGTTTGKAFICLAANMDGTIYTVDMTGDVFGQINPSTGGFTSIGSIGFNCGYAQDMEFDHRSGDLIYAAFNYTTMKGELRIIDPATGTARLYDQFLSGAEITALAPPSPEVRVLAPNGGENWAGGTSHQVSFFSGTYAAAWKAEYTTNAGTSWFDVDASLPMTGTGVFTGSWTVPNVSSSQCKMRVKNIMNTAVFDESDNFFTITSSNPLTINSPNGGENWAAGTTHNITWTMNGFYNCKLDYTTNNGTSWFEITPSLPITGSTSYPWTVPATPSSQCRVRIMDNNNVSNYDMSDNMFKISPSFTLTAPNGGENWRAGTAQNITWTNNSFTAGKLDYSTNGGISWLEITPSLPITGMNQYQWTVPPTLSSHCKVKIADINNSANFDISDNEFTISSSFTLTSPNGGENWQAGTSHNIVWTNYSFAAGKLDYTTNGGISWMEITPSLPITGANSYAWNVPNTASTNCKVKISQINFPANFDMSDNEFTITGINQLQITSPAGGESWQAGTVHNITWTQTGVPNVKISYSTNAGSTWTDIIASTSGGTYPWTVPNTPGSQTKVKITDVTNITLFSISNNFTITPPQTCKQVNVLSGWNILSVPVLATDMTGNILFPDVSSSFYKYSGGYSTVTSLSVGSGYWAKFPTVKTYTICGSGVYPPHAAVSAGWNLIGTFSNDVPVNVITTIPEGIISSSFYEYNSGYIIPTVLSVGKGYWVKVNQNGTIVLPIPVEMKTTSYVSGNRFEGFGRIIITGSNGKTTTLYVAENDKNLTAYEMPPVPPEGVTDARYSSGRIAECLDVEKEIILQGFEYPVSIKATGKDIRIKDMINGKFVDAVIKSGEEISVMQKDIKAFSVIANNIPDKYSLSQNYPNPFNPTTIINYEIPTSPSFPLLEGEGGRGIVTS